MPTVGLILGSESDRDIGDKIFKILTNFKIKVEYKIISAHRNPEALKGYLKKNEAEVYVAVAGLSAALPGTIAAHTIKPVIGVPKEVKISGLDALLSIVQMPPGIPVACVGIDNATNAAIMAITILTLRYNELKEKLIEYRKELKKKGLKSIN